MTNDQKYKTAEERKIAHTAYCNRMSDECPLLDDLSTDTRCTDCAFSWLALEAEEEKPDACPFCGGECRTVKNKCEGHVVGCDNCCYCSRDFDSEAEAITAHNRVARAVRAAKESEAKHEED